MFSKAPFFRISEKLHNGKQGFALTTRYRTVFFFISSPVNFVLFIELISQTLFLILRCFSCCICIAPKFPKNNTVFLCLTDIYSFLNKYNCLLKLQTQRVKKETPEIFPASLHNFSSYFSSASRIRMPGYLLLQLPSPVR